MARISSVRFRRRIILLSVLFALIFAPLIVLMRRRSGETPQPDDEVPENYRKKKSARR